LFVPAAPSPPIIQFVDASTGQVKQLASIDKPIFTNMCVSRDGRYIVWPQIDQSTVDLLLVENFK
jgi:hypothetical protein